MSSDRPSDDTPGVAQLTSTGWTLQMINGTEIDVYSNEIINFLEKTLRYKEVRQSVLYQRVIERAANTRNIRVDPDEIQAEAEQFRRDNRLERSADTLAWLADQQITADIWEAGIRDRLLAQKLAESLFGREAEPFFAQNRLDFEQVVLYQIIVPYEQLAMELFYEIEESEISFYEAAHLYDISQTRRRHCGYEGVLYRWSVQPAIAPTVFAATPGQVVRPIQTDQGHHILLIEEFITAELTSEIRQQIINRLFQEWLQAELNYMLHNQED